MNEWEINKGLEIFFGDGGLKEKVVVIREVVIYGNWGLVIRKLCSTATAVMCIEKEKDSEGWGWREWYNYYNGGSIRNGLVGVREKTKWVLLKRIVY